MSTKDPLLDRLDRVNVLGRNADAQVVGALAVLHPQILEEIIGLLLKEQEKGS